MGNATVKKPADLTTMILMVTGLCCPGTDTLRHPQGVYEA